MPVKRGNGQVPLKTGMDIEKYGGYNKVAASFFVIAKYKKGGKNEVSFVPVELMAAEKFMADEVFAKEYIRQVLENLNTKKIEDVELPFGKRTVKIKSMLSLDGYRVWINGKASGGKQILLSNAESLVLSDTYISYVKKMENYTEKKKNNRNIQHDSEYDGLSEEKNMELYNELIKKVGNNHYIKMPGSQYKTLVEGQQKFAKLLFDEQIKVLLNCIELLKSGRAGGCDLSGIGGKASSGVMILGANLSSCKSKEICLLDVSPAGIHTVSTMNLMELLK